MGHIPSHVSATTLLPLLLVHVGIANRLWPMSKLWLSMAELAVRRSRIDGWLQVIEIKMVCCGLKDLGLPSWCGRSLRADQSMLQISEWFDETTAYRCIHTYTADSL